MRRANVDAELREQLKQPSRDFTGRKKELAEFGRRVKSGLTERVWYLHGYGGVGKSDLLKTFRSACKQESFPCAYIDLSTDEAKSEPGLLHEIALELGITELPTFNRCYNRYDRLIKTQPTAADASRELGDVVSAAASLSGIRTGGLVDKVKERLSSRMSVDDAAFLGHAAEELFRAFTGDLCDYIATDNRVSPVVLLLDTYEQASPAQTDLLELLILACRRMELPVLIVVAGRDDPELLRYDDLALWQNEVMMDTYCLGNLEEADEFLRKRGVTHPKLVERIMKLTDRFPMFLRMACEVVKKSRGDQAEIAEEFPEGEMDRKKVTEYLLGRILERLPEKHSHLRTAIRKLGLGRWFDKEILAMLMDAKVSEITDDWHTLTNMSLVQPLARSGRWKLHDPIRDSIQSEWKDAGNEPLEYHQKLADYHAGHKDDFAHLREWFYHHVTFEPRETIEEWGNLCEACLASMKIGDYDVLLADSFEYMIPWDGMEERAAAETHFAIGYALGEYPTKRTALMEECIRHYEAALRVYTEKDFPQQWAMTRNNLGNAYGELPTGDKGENLRKAIECFEAALRVHTEGSFPQDWAMTQNNMGEAYRQLPTGDMGENLRKAIACFEAAQRICTEKDFPHEWAMMKNNLGIAYQWLPTGDRGENLWKAIEHYEAALRVHTERHFPQQWAQTRNNLGVAYQWLPTGDRGENLRKAIECFESTLRVRLERDFPHDWAMTQNNLGIAYRNLLTGDRRANLCKAIECYEAALRVCTEKDFPQRWAQMRFNLGFAYRDMAWLLGSIDVMKQARACFLDSERVYTSVGCPRDAENARSGAAEIEDELRQMREDMPSE